MISRRKKEEREISRFMAQNANQDIWGDAKEEKLNSASERRKTLDRLTARSRASEEDVNELSKRIKKGMTRRHEKKT